MAKGKNLNPADLYRKTQRKKELKRNKTERAKTRNFALVKKDTGELEDEIEKLEANAKLSASDKSRLTSLKSKLSNIMEKKADFVKEHPEQRKLVYRARKQEIGENQKPPPPTEQKRNLFTKHGIPRHPERSIYYDPVMNPYGVAPPGQPYIERLLAPGEMNSDGDNDDEDSDEDIVMPKGPPPGTSKKEKDSEDDSDDDIPMPKGPPPGTSKEDSENGGGDDIAMPKGPLPGKTQTPVPVPLPPHMPLSVPPSLPLMLPAPIPGFPGGAYASSAGFIPPPPPPPGFYPGRNPSAAATIPHQTYQAHRAGQLPPGHASLPPKPVVSAPGAAPAPAIHAAATISAEPELRDLKKEATAFVPASLKRKRASHSKVNAAPSINDAGSEVTSLQARPDLVGAVKKQLETITPPSHDEPADKRRKAFGNHED